MVTVVTEEDKKEAFEEILQATGANNSQQLGLYFFKEEGM